MRLMRYDSNGEIVFSEFLYNYPKYAILSHTWFRDHEEVTFQDLIVGKGKSKAGYSKIKFCGEQARRDGLWYFWVDTCCIDRLSSAELGEAVNSMFGWYRDATKCYVYLADIPTLTVVADVESNKQSWEIAFKTSRWFTRGWTLQELLAPVSVDFFNRDGQLLGNKDSLMQPIHEITGIPIPALQGSPLSGFSVYERLSWLNMRQTTRSEDKAYSALGLFGVFLPLIYGEGGEHAFKRLRKEIARHSLLRPEKGLESIIDAGSESSSTFDEVESIFSDSGVSMSSKSSSGINPVHVSGIREVTRALLSRDDFKSLCTVAVSDIAPRKSRAHIRGFLKKYGQQLDEEAASSLQHQAAMFVQEVAGRVADEIRWSITGDEVNKSVDTGVEQQNLETWISNIENGLSKVDLQPDPRFNPNQLVDDDNESDDEPEITAAFPNIVAVREFLLSSNAFTALLQVLENWMSGNKRQILHAKEGDFLASEVVKNTELEDSTHRDEAPADTPAPTVSERYLPEKPMSSSAGMESQPRSISRSQSAKSLISGLLDFWGISFFVYDLLELLVPPIPIGFERIRWRCSCNTVLWGDFPVDDPDALNSLKHDLCKNISSVVSSRRASRASKIPATQRSYSLPGDQASAETSFSNSSSQTATTPEGLAGSSSNGGQRSGRFNSTSELSAPSNEIGTHLASLTEVTVDKRVPTYLEICTNIGDYAVGHFELDISQAATDGELFEKIWDIYNQKRGFGIRRLFLRPRDVHFVMFSISNKRAARYSAGIHRTPKEYPPDEELQEQRYHYFSPKIIMPAHIFIHFLHRARWNVWGDHADDTWLKRLPKKLNKSILAAQTANTDPGLVFGWGVHILDGPNHAVLGFFLALGLMVTFVISCLIVGIAKTQEQAFGVGQYLVAIVVALMSALYFMLQDQ